MRFALRLAIIVCAASVAASSSAQDAPLSDFSAVRFLPAPGPGNYATVDGASVGGDMLPTVGLWLDYAHRPFTLYDATCDLDPMGEPINCETTGVNRHLVKMTALAHITASFSLFDRLQIGLLLPLGYTTGQPFEVDIDGMRRIVGGQEDFVLGDPQLSVKGNLFQTESGGVEVGLGARVYAAFPLGQQLTEAASYIGDESVRLGGHVIGELGASGFHLAVNVGGFWREEQTLFSTVAGPMLTYQGAIGYDITPLITVFGEVDGASTFGAQVDENPLEGRLAGRLRQGDFTFNLGGGAGLVSGVGVPVFRVFGGVTWAPIRIDSDHDGVLDDADGCPSEPEDVDSYFDEDGCPEPDNDSDGFLDADDRCPTEAEDRDEHEDEDGCPDRDNDGDGVADGYDSCPAEPEDMDGDRDEDGCPDNDTDRDGIADPDDRCPTEPEDTDGYGDEDGCPETDFDNDGILDDGDACPDQPEIVNGVEDDDGCPEEDTDSDGIPNPVDRCPNEAETLNGRQDDDGCPDGDELVRVEGQTIRLMQQVQFRTNSAQIRGARSFQILDAVATILTRNPSYRRVRVEGHTDDRGDADRNRGLSMDRAQSCIDYLVRKGIATERLYAQGFGPDRPIGDNTTNEGRTANRRVEFHIEPIGPGSENVTQEVEADASGEAPEAPPAE
jgi:outer membrane protein OmpA-like peptidoglycan-associated protein